MYDKRLLGLRRLAFNLKIVDALKIIIWLLLPHKEHILNHSNVFHIFFFLNQILFFYIQDQWLVDYVLSQI